MSDTYYVRIRGRVHGPMEMTRLQSLATKGQLSRIHDVSSDGQSWQKASTVPEIFERRAASVPTAGSQRMAAVRENRQPAGHVVAESGPAEGQSPSSTTTSSGSPPGGDTAAWHYSINSMQYGPVSKMDLAQLVKNGSLANDDLVWKEGMASWGEAGNVGELAGLFRGVKKGRKKNGGGIDENLTDPMRRLMARVIDRMVVLFAIGISVLLLVAAALIGGLSIGIVNPDGQADGAAAALTLGVMIAWAAAVIVPIGIVGIVQVYYLSTYSQSIGKRMLKMQIVRIEDDQPAGFGNGFVLRSMCNNLIILLLLVPTLGAYFIIDACFIFRDDRRCIHDLIAKTKVIDID